MRIIFKDRIIETDIAIRLNDHVIIYCIETVDSEHPVYYGLASTSKSAIDTVYELLKKEGVIDLNVIYEWDDVDDFIVFRYASNYKFNFGMTCWWDASYGYNKTPFKAISDLEPYIKETEEMKGYPIKSE